GGSETQVVVTRRRAPADGFLPGAPRGIEGEIAMAGEKGFCLRLILLEEQRAGGVNEAAAGFYQAGRAGQDVALANDKLGQVLRPGAPLAVGVAPPAAD